MQYNFDHSKWRVFKFYHLLKERIGSALSCELVIPDIGSSGLVDSDIEHWARMGVSRLGEIEKEISAKNPDKAVIAWALATTSLTIRAGKFPYDFSQILPFLKRANEIHPRVAVPVSQYLTSLNSVPDPLCVKVVEEILPCAPNLSDEILANITKCLKSNGMKFDHSVLHNRGISVVDFSESSLSDHYRMFAKLTLESGAKFVAVQYPTLPLESLHSHFKGLEQPVIFVSNETNFQNALMTSPYNAIFTDNFRGSWGHTTERGHSLIAHSILHAVEPIVKNLNTRK